MLLTYPARFAEQGAWDFDWDEALFGRLATYERQAEKEMAGQARHDKDLIHPPFFLQK